MSKTVTVTDENFDEVVKEGVVLIDFWASWCGPCKMIAPILDEIATENPTITIGKMDVDENSIKPAEFKIRSIPTMFVFKDGVHVDGMMGALPKNSIITKLNEYL